MLASFLNVGKVYVGQNLGNVPWSSRGREWHTPDAGEDPRHQRISGALITKII